jgi:hypothetical protein
MKQRIRKPYQPKRTIEQNLTSFLLYIIWLFAVTIIVSYFLIT